MATRARLVTGGGKMAFAGYPGLREHVLSVDTNCEDAHFRESGYGAYIAVDCAAMHGDSGGPLFFLENDELTVIGTLSSGWIENGEVVNAITPIGNIDDAVLEALGDAQHHGDGKAGN